MTSSRSDPTSTARRDRRATGGAPCVLRRVFVTTVTTRVGVAEARAIAELAEKYVPNGEIRLTVEQVCGGGGTGVLFSFPLRCDVLFWFVLWFVVCGSWF